MRVRQAIWPKSPTSSLRPARSPIGASAPRRISRACLPLSRPTCVPATPACCAWRAGIKPRRWRRYGCLYCEELPAYDEPLAEAVPEGSGSETAARSGIERRALSFRIARERRYRPRQGRCAGPDRAHGGLRGRPNGWRGPRTRPDRTRLRRRARARRGVALPAHASGPEAAILKAHLAILGDVTLHREIAQRIDYGRSAARAVVEAGEHFSALLQRAESAYIRERAVDVQELCGELLEEIYGADFQPAAIELHEPSILAAETLAPHQLLALDRRWLEGIVLESAGATSHAVILARSMGIPTVVGVAGATRAAYVRRGDDRGRRSRTGVPSMPRPGAPLLRPRTHRRAPPSGRARAVRLRARDNHRQRTVSRSAPISPPPRRPLPPSRAAPMEWACSVRSCSSRDATPRPRKTNSSRSTPPPRARRMDAR